MLKFQLLLLIIFPFLSYSQPNLKNKKKGELIINGTLNNVKEHIPYVYIICSDGKNGYDSVQVINHRYSFRVYTGATSLVTLYAKNPTKMFTKDDLFAFITEPSVVKVTSKDSFSNIKVSGSKAYLEDKRLNAKTKSVFEQFSRLNEEYITREKKNGVDRSEQLEQKRDSVLQKIYEEYVNTHPASLILPYAAYKYIRLLNNNPSVSDVEKGKKMYAMLSSDQTNSYFGRRARKKLDSYSISVGMTAPDFVQNDTLGNPVSLASFKGKFVLLDFWASWCGPCRRENPYLIKTFNEYKDKGFTIVSVSLDKMEEKDKWLEAIRRDGLVWTNVSDLKFWDNAIAKQYYVSSIPQNFLIDPAGKIVAIGLHGDDLTRKLAEVLN